MILGVSGPRFRGGPSCSCSYRQQNSPVERTLVGVVCLLRMTHQGAGTGYVGGWAADAVGEKASKKFGLERVCRWTDAPVCQVPMHVLYGTSAGGPTTGSLQRGEDIINVGSLILSIRSEGLC